MCQFNLAILDKVSDESKLKDIFERNGFNFTLLQNQYLNKLISPDLKVIFTTISHCDCGSAISIDSKDNSIKRDIEKEIKKLKRKKWSDSKIQKYLDNKEKDEFRKQSETGDTNKRELDNWFNTIDDCFRENISKRFGILTHFYSGTIEGERFDKLTSENCTFKDFQVDSLKELVFDKLLLIGRLMAHKQKGQMTTSGEWARHLRGFLKRQFWKGERKAGKNMIKKDSYNE